MGGSFGIAIINTFIAHRAAVNRSALVTHANAANPATAEHMRIGVINFMAHGSNLIRAGQQALAALEATINRQTFLMSYMDAFFLLAALNALCIPLVIVTIKKKKATQATKMVIPDH